MHFFYKNIKNIYNFTEQNVKTIVREAKTFEISMLFSSLSYIATAFT